MGLDLMPTWWEVWDMFPPHKQCEYLWRIWLAG